MTNYVTDIFVIPPHGADKDVTAGDLPIEVLVWSCGLRTLREIPPEPEPIPEEVLPPAPYVMPYPELLALGREGKQVNATQALLLLEGYRKAVSCLLRAARHPQLSTAALGEMARGSALAIQLAQQETQ